MQSDTKAELERRLVAAFAPEHFVLEDQSGRHRGHAGSSGGGHYAVTLVSAQFEGKTPVERHRMVYEALQGLIPTQVHALTLNALTPDQWRAALSTR